MFLVIKIRLNLSMLFQSLSINSKPSRDDGTFSSALYYEGVSNCLPFIKKAKLNADHGAYFSIYSVLCVFKARRSGGGETTPELIREQYKKENLWAPNNDYEMDKLQNALKSKYGEILPWSEIP